jgi:chromosome partitioning protein
MSAKIIVLANQKGGAGKTNVAVHLAGSCVRHGYKTLLIDADPQGTATKWISQSDEEAVFKIRVMGLAMAGQKIAKEVKQYVDDYDVIIADCPPAVDSPIPQVMLMIADLALVPIIPNPGDLWAATDLLEMAERIQLSNSDLEIRIVASNVRGNLALTKVALLNMAKMRESAPLMKAMLHQRSVYVESMLAGDSVHYFGQSAKLAIAEVEALYDEVITILKLPRNHK